MRQVPSFFTEGSVLFCFIRAVLWKKIPMGQKCTVRLRGHPGSGVHVYRSRFLDSVCKCGIADVRILVCVLELSQIALCLWSYYTPIITYWGISIDYLCKCKWPVFFLITSLPMCFWCLNKFLDSYHIFYIYCSCSYLLPITACGISF